jgi:hypothetical protein
VCQFDERSGRTRSRRRDGRFHEKRPERAPGPSARKSRRPPKGLAGHLGKRAPVIAYTYILYVGTSVDPRLPIYSTLPHKASKVRTLFAKRSGERTSMQLSIARRAPQGTALAFCVAPSPRHPPLPGTYIRTHTPPLRHTSYFVKVLADSVRRSTRPEARRHAAWRATPTAGTAGTER